MTRIGDELVAVLQRRGEFNPEKMDDESWPGACQVTSHGKLNDGEGWVDGLIREATEELGRGIEIHLQNCNWATLREKKGKEHARTYGIIAPPHVLQDIRLEPVSGGMKILKRSELCHILDLRTNFNKTEGVRDRQVIAMFPDEIEAVKAAFEKFE